MVTIKTLKWRFDVNTFRLLGRELITDRITALFELVKNSYDANAEEVVVEFYNLNELNENSKIVIRDNGTGMSFNEIKNGWMVVGTNFKRIKKITDAPYNRKIIGEKGIGRFAVDKLGSKLTLKTKPLISGQWFILEIDWSKYELLAKKTSNKKFFTDIENKLTYEKSDKQTKGTYLVITKINEIWTKLDINRAFKELSKLVSPFNTLKPPFKIKIFSNEHPEFNEQNIQNESIKFASNEINLKSDLSEKTQEILRFEDGKLKTYKQPLRIFGPCNFHLYHFDRYAKGNFRKNYKGGSIDIDGIKIYRDGIITTPFAEYEANINNQRDILGIDKRRWSEFFDKISSRDLIGIFEITKMHNPKIIDSTNRQDFVDNEEYRDLKDYIIEQIAELEKFLKYTKESSREQSSKNLSIAKDDFDVFYSELTQIGRQFPTLNKKIAPLKKKARDIKIFIKRGIRIQNELEKELVRKEDFYLSLMSLQDYAVDIAHVIRTSLSEIKSRAEFFKKHFPDEKFNLLFIKYSTEIYDEMNRLSNVMDFMLSYAKANIDIEEFNIKDTIEKVFNNYDHHFKKEGIKPIVEISNPFILSHNKKFIEDIFENLISNSIKALRFRKNKIIKCTAFQENDNYLIYFTDNGVGIDKKNRNKIFEIYFTTTAEEGGAGVGLYTVKKRIEALKGTIKLVESEFKSQGATFKIEIPYKKEK